MYKLVAIDLDDTTLNSDNIVSKENELAVKACEKAGIKVVVATGRTRYGILRYLEQMELTHNRHVAINGGMLLDYDGEGEITKSIPEDKFLALIDTLRELKREFMAYRKDGNGLTFEYAPRLQIPVKVYHGEDHVAEGDTAGEIGSCRICAYYEDEEDLAFMRSICPTGLFTTAWGHIIDYMPQGLTKYFGMQKLLAHYGLEPNQIAAIGDQESDVDIIRNAGLGVAVSNCDEHLRAAADVVLDKSNNESAVAEMIYRYILN